MRKSLFFLFSGLLLISGVILAQAPGLPPAVSKGAASPATKPISNVPVDEEKPDLSQFQNQEGYHYEPTGRRDPFKAFGESQAAQAPEMKANIESEVEIPKEPLEMYDVSQFKLVGIIWNVNDPKAMVKDPGGKLHMVRKETKIGRNNGFVAAIREGEIIVVEPAVSDGGMQTAITRVLTLKR